MAISTYRATLTDIASVKVVTEKNAKAIIEMIRGISEIIVYSEQKKGEYFE